MRGKSLHSPSVEDSHCLTEIPGVNSFIHSERGRQRSFTQRTRQIVWTIDARDEGGIPSVVN